MALHPQAQSLIDMFAASGAPPLPESTIEEARERAGMIRQLLGPGPEVVEVRDIRIPTPDGEIGARIYRPTADATGTVVYFHGGGWVLGAIEDFDALARALAVESGAQLVSVDYRLAPEHRFPAAADDAFAGLVWVAENLPGDGLVVAGDSAGGNLAAVCARRARDNGGPSLALQVLVYPVTDHDFERPSYSEHGNSGLLLGRGDMEWFWNHYVPSIEDRNHPDASPLCAFDLSGLAPAYVVIAEYDPLRDEGQAYADRLAAAGIPVTVKRYEDQLHGFFILVNFLETADVAVKEAGQTIRAALDGN
jgi:acetyl esterase